MAQRPSIEQTTAALKGIKDFKPPSNEEIVNNTQRVTEHAEINGTVEGYPTANPDKGRLIYQSQTISEVGVQSIQSGPGGFTYLAQTPGSFDTTITTGYGGTLVSYASQGTNADVPQNAVKSVGRNKVGSVKRK